MRPVALISTEQSDRLQASIAQKIEELRRYDVLAMDRAVAILSWGRSGSLLLASYFDGHDSVLMLPELCAWKLYEFFDCHPSLPLREKLLAYPSYAPEFTQFFEGRFTIEPGEYAASVEAIIESSKEWPEEFTGSRRAFFLLMHVAYRLALGRGPAGPNPVIVYPQHLQDSASAAHLVEDFPHARFLHTVRDPISCCDRTFHHFLDSLSDRHILLPSSVLESLTGDDRPQAGVESRTLAVRFEDLHVNTEQTLRDLCDWLGLPFQGAMLDSTFNGVAYVVAREGQSWTGAKLEQAQRHARYHSAKDRALLFALFYENFRDWKYPHPKAVKYRIARLIVVLTLFVFPLGTENVGARTVFDRRVLPALRRGAILRGIKPLLAVAHCRLKIMWLLVSVTLRRIVRPPAVLPLDPSGAPGTQ